MNDYENALNKKRNNKLNKVGTIRFVFDVTSLFVNIGVRPVILDKKKYFLVNDINNARSNQIILPQLDRS